MYEKADKYSPHTQALLREYAMLGRESVTRDAVRLCERILARVGMDPLGPVPFNCDLSLLREVRDPVVGRGARE